MDKSDQKGIIKRGIHCCEWFGPISTICNFTQLCVYHKRINLSMSSDETGEAQIGNLVTGDPSLKHNQPIALKGLLSEAYPDVFGNEKGKQATIWLLNIE